MPGDTLEACRVALHRGSDVSGSAGTSVISVNNTIYWDIKPEKRNPVYSWCFTATLLASLMCAVHVVANCKGQPRRYLSLSLLSVF